MIKFKPLEIEDKAIIDSFTLKSECRNCDMSFANIFCWRAFHKSHWAIVDGFLVIRFIIDGKEQVGYMQPIGEGSFFHILPLLAEDAMLNFNQRLRMYGLCREGRKVITDANGKEFAFDDNRALSDYIYLREDLLSLTGRRYQPKRNHFNRFSSTYNYRYEELTPQHFADCMALEKQWREARGANGDDEAIYYEELALKEAFENWDALQLKGGVIYVDDKLAAFTYGSPINYDTFDCHIEKADTKFEGIFAAINKLFASSIGEEFTYINREEDMGLEGLRRSKLSYYPTLLWPKTTAIHLTKEELSCKELWQEVFSDSDEFIDKFLLQHFKSEQMLCIKEQESIISMLHLIPMELNGSKVGYVYGVATKSSHRKRGYASELLRRAEQRASEVGMEALILIPAGVEAAKFYSDLGYSENIPITFRSKRDFDFGTGTTENNRAMILKLNPEFNPVSDIDEPLITLIVAN